MQITWYGHSAFRLDFGGKAVLIDPFFTGNPAFVSDRAAAIKGVSQIVLTHGHGDHVGDTLDIAILFGDVERVADMIAVAVGEHDLADALDRRGPVRDKGRIAGEERIDENGFAAEIEPECRMAVPGDLHGVLLLLGGPFRSIEHSGNQPRVLVPAACQSCRSSRSLPCLAR